MGECVGMDVLLEEVSICVLNDEGRVLARGTMSSDPRRGQRVALVDRRPVL